MYCSKNTITPQIKRYIRLKFKCSSHAQNILVFPLHLTMTISAAPSCSATTTTKLLVTPASLRSTSLSLLSSGGPAQPPMSENMLKDAPHVNRTRQILAPPYPPLLQSSPPVPAPSNKSPVPSSWIFPFPHLLTLFWLWSTMGLLRG